jgi:hypothetical protein
LALLRDEIKNLKDSKNVLNKDVACLRITVDELTNRLNAQEPHKEFSVNQATLARFDGTQPSYNDYSMTCSMTHGKGQGFGASAPAVSLWASNGVSLQTHEDLERWEAHVWTTLFLKDQAFGLAVVEKVHTCYLRWSSTTVVGMDFPDVINV